jgi:ABC-2 type transport system permease protein
VSQRTWAITKREYLERVRARWFLIATFGLPVILVGIVFLPQLVVSRGASEDAGLNLGVLDYSGRVESDVGHVLGERWTVQPVRGVHERREEELRASLMATSLDGLLVVGEDPADGGSVRLLTRRAISSRQGRELRDGIRGALVATRLRELGIEEIDTRRLFRGVDLQIILVTPEGERSREAFQIVAMLFAVVTYMMFLIYGQLIVRAVLEEKSSNVVEVMMSSVRPWEMMLGKMFGVGAVGLTQIAIWAAIGTLLSLYGLPGLTSALAAEGIDLAQVQLPLGLLAWALIYFTLGYLLYAGLFLAAGASLGNEQDAQQVVTPLVVIIVVGFILVIGIIESPDSGWAVVGSLVPLFSPMIVPARLAISHVPALELAGSVGLLVLGMLGSAWMAGRIYRVAILMSGKRANLREMVRWIRHG